MIAAVVAKTWTTTKAVVAEINTAEVVVDQDNNSNSYVIRDNDSSSNRHLMMMLHETAESVERLKAASHFNTVASDSNTITWKTAVAIKILVTASVLCRTNTIETAVAAACNQTLTEAAARTRTPVEVRSKTRTLIVTATQGIQSVNSSKFEKKELKVAAFGAKNDEMMITATTAENEKIICRSNKNKITVGTWKKMTFSAAFSVTIFLQLLTIFCCY